MNKFFTALVITVVCSLCFIAPVSADILPYAGISFLHQHEADCVPIDEFYYANGVKGFVALKDAPDFIGNAHTVENGQSLHIVFTYDDNGVTWGFVNMHMMGGNGPTGWTLMDQLSAADAGLYSAKAPGFFDRLSFLDIVIVLVVIVVAGTMVLIRVTRKPSKRTER